MHPLDTRRQFFGKSMRLALSASSLALLQPRLGAVEPFQRKGKSRMLLGLAAYSMREFFQDTNHERTKNVPENKRISLFDFIDFCSENGCHGAELTSYYFPKDVTPEFLLKVRRHAFLRGIDICGGAVGNTFTHPAGEKRNQEIAMVKKWIDHCQVLGAPHLRVFAGAAQKQSAVEATKLCLEALDECCAYAAKKGVFLGLENHGGIVAEATPLLEIIKTVKSDWLGINLDSGNFHTADPYGDFERCAPYAVNVQLKGELRAAGKQAERADFARFIQILNKAGYQGYVTLEYEEAEDPWVAIPRLLKELKPLLSA